jgi:hypothetical protein
MLRVTDCIRDGLRPNIPQATEGQHIGDQIDAALILTRADFIKVGAIGRFVGLELLRETPVKAWLSAVTDYPSKRTPS